MKMESRQTSTTLPRPTEAERGHLDRGVVGDLRIVDF